MSEMTILHVSDIHFKKIKPHKRIDCRESVQKKMTEAIKEHIKTIRSPDIVAVTGDISFSGKAIEFKEAMTFFDDLKTVLPSNTEFLVVPGNHDVERDKIDDFSLLQQTVVQANRIDEFLGNKNQIKSKINNKFKNYRSFVKILNPAFYKENHDYFWVKNLKDQQVSLLGLNSCWASEGDQDDGNIALGKFQVEQAIEKSEFPHRILLMHHPFDWLNRKDLGKIRGIIFNHCQLVLHGHTHMDDALVIHDPNNACICLGANASFSGDKEGFWGFQFIHVDFSNNFTAVRVWPYRFEERDEPRFVPDRDRWKGQNGKEYFDLKISSSKDSEKPTLPVEIPKEYNDWIKKYHSIMNIDLLARKGEVITVDLPEIYIPIETRNPFYKPKEEGHKGAKGEKYILEGIAEPGVEEVSEDLDANKEPPTIDIEALLGRKKLILLRGEAGTGKTTLIKHLAYTLSSDTCNASLRGCLPVLVFLKDLWLIYSEEIKENQNKLVCEDLLEKYLEKSKCQLSWEAVSTYLAHQRAIFLIDGLDEVPLHLRTDLVDMMARFQYQYKNNRFLFTGRPHGIKGPALARFGDDLHDIEPLNEQLIKDFINKWFRAVSGCATGIGEHTAEGMISDIRQHEHINIFTRNPLLLTAVCILYQDGKRIPDQRADLYNRIIDNLINRRFHDPAHPGKENEILEFLMALAFNVQKKNRKTIEKEDALDTLGRLLTRKQGKQEEFYKRRVEELFDEIELNCGLFNRLGTGEIEFTHLTFQEFLAAKYLVYMDIDWRKFLEKEWWEETMLLYAGFISLDRKRTCNDLVKSMLKTKTRFRIDKKKRYRLQLLGARALCDFQEMKRDETVLAVACKQMVELIESDAPLEVRFQAGVHLGSLGDTRIKPDNMVHIPAGKFIRGSNEYDRTKPERQIYLDEYMIGIYPVTNQEYKRFIEDRGYHQKEFWTEEGWQWRHKNYITDPLYWYDRKWNGPNFPVIGVSWYEAVAYTGWLSKITGKSYHLPTEAQWEKAARGIDGKKYPWGNKFEKNLCNSWESGIGSTSPVGIFPGGKSDYGCLDMAGNVWEWCADWYDGKYYSKSPANNPIGPETGSGRVNRGGGWAFGAGNCACALRRFYRPAFRGFDLGFRFAGSF